MSKSMKVLKSLRLSFVLATTVSAGGTFYHMDKSHYHGISNPYHDTIDTVYETGKATDAQKDELVEAAIQSGRDAEKSNLWLLGAGTSYLGVWLTGGLAARRRTQSKPSGPKA